MNKKEKYFPPLAEECEMLAGASLMQEVSTQSFVEDDEFDNSKWYLD